MTTHPTKQPRIYYLDILRAIACLAVIMIHVTADYAVTDIGSTNFWLGNIFDSLSRIGVPLFVMISGSLLLDKSYNFTKTKLTKHLARFAIFFVFWSALYAIVFHLITPLAESNPVSPTALVTSFLRGHFHLWFIFMIAGLYLILPLLRTWVTDKNKKQIEYFLILAIILTFAIPQFIALGLQATSTGSPINQILSALDSVVKNLNLQYVGGCTTYFILGWYLRNYGLKKEKFVYALGVAGLIFTILATGLLSIRKGESVLAYSNLYLNVLLYAVAVFLFFRNKFTQKTNPSKLTLALSKYSFGIYAVHPLIITYSYAALTSLGHTNALLCIPLVFIIATALSFGVSYLFSKIPLLKKTV